MPSKKPKPPSEKMQIAQFANSELLKAKQFSAQHKGFKVLHNFYEGQVVAFNRILDKIIEIGLNDIGDRLKEKLKKKNKPKTHNTTMPKLQEFGNRRPRPKKRKR